MNSDSAVNGFAAPQDSKGSNIILNSIVAIGHLKRKNEQNVTLNLLNATWAIFPSAWFRYAILFICTNSLSELRYEVGAHGLLHEATLVLKLSSDNEIS